MPAVDALHLRTALTEQMDNHKFRQILDIYARLSAEQMHRSEQLISSYFGIEAMAQALSQAECYYVAPNMHELAMLASEDFPEDEVIRTDDPPSDAGLMLLPSRFRYIEMRGNLEVVHGVLWRGNRLWMLNDRFDPDSEMSKRIMDDLVKKLGQDGAEAERRAHGRWDVCGNLNFEFGQPIPVSYTFDKGVLPPNAKVEFAETEDGKRILATDYPIDLTKEIKPRVDPFLKFILAVWRLMQQSLADVHEATDTPRPARRRAERKHVPTAVTIIQLRRREEHHHEPTGKTINYRTLVRGHWRRVWVGKMDGSEQRYQRAIYVHPFIRGPEGAPLIVRRRVNALVR